MGISYSVQNRNNKYKQCHLYVLHKNTSLKLTFFSHIDDWSIIIYVKDHSTLLYYTYGEFHKLDECVYVDKFLDSFLLRCFIYLSLNLFHCISHHLILKLNNKSLYLIVGIFQLCSFQDYFDLFWDFIFSNIRISCQFLLNNLKFLLNNWNFYWDSSKPMHQFRENWHLCDMDSIHCISHHLIRF